MTHKFLSGTMPPASPVPVWLRGLVSADKGVSNTLLARLGRTSCRGGDFYGVYPANKIPRWICKRGRFVIIVNLGERVPGRRLPVGHFVCVAGERRRVNYIDSYGMPCMQPKVLRFLKDCRREIWENEKQMQHLESAYCGLYALLFTVYFDRKFSHALPPGFKLRFYKGGLKSNDKKCVQYLQQLL